jgi:hypothetical protein
MAKRRSYYLVPPQARCYRPDSHPTLTKEAAISH